MMKSILFSLSMIIVCSVSQAQWSQKISGTSNNLNDVHFCSTLVGLAVGVNGTIVKSVDGGESWNSLTAGVSVDFESVYLVNENLGFVVGDTLMLKTTDGGSNWSPVNLPVAESLLDIEFSDANTGFCVGYNGTVLKTIDGGTTWVQKPSDCTRFLAKVYFPTPNVGYATSRGYNSNFIKTTDGG